MDFMSFWVSFHLVLEPSLPDKDNVENGVENENDGSHTEESSRTEREEDNESDKWNLLDQRTKTVDRPQGESKGDTVFI